MSEKSPKITSIVMLRAIAALGVSLVHLQIISNFHYNKYIDLAINTGQNGVYAFFVISGFILPYSLDKSNYQISNFFTFLLKRSIRVDPPFWASIILLFVCMVAPLSVLNFKQVLLHVTYLVPFFESWWYNGIYWTLGVEFQYYVVLGLSFSILNKQHSLVQVSILLAVSLIAYKLQLPRGILTVYFYQFTFGYIAYLTYTKRLSLITGTLILSAAGVFTLFDISITWAMVPYLAAMFILFYPQKWNFKPLYLIGTISYSLYLIHSSIGAVFIRTVLAWTTNQYVLLFGALLIAILFAWLMYISVEKVALRLSKHIKFK